MDREGSFSSVFAVCAGAEGPLTVSLRSAAGGFCWAVMGGGGGGDTLACLGFPQPARLRIKTNINPAWRDSSGPALASRVCASPDNPPFWPVFPRQYAEPGSSDDGRREPPRRSDRRSARQSPFPYFR